MTPLRGRRLSAEVLLLGLCLAAGAPDAYAQLGALVSPGRLSRPHAALEGIGSCLQCHSAGRQVSAEKCLTCHKPVAERIAQKRGIHRTVTTDCVSCHVEHAGVDGELRPFDRRGFDHAARTGFALDGLHAPLAASCESCHKTRSFLTVGPSCASCHTDAHKGTLGPQCSNCHATSVRFAETRSRFDHTKTAFPLTGAHSSVTCASCHRNATYKGIAFASCASCHTDPHSPRLPGRCESCHTTQAWRTTRVDHSRTAFSLKGLHASVRCAACHTKPAMQVTPKADTCASCHADPHRGTFTQDCASCHNESGFRKGAFDHSTTRFPLADKHGGLACVACHKEGAVPAPAPARGRAAPAPARSGSRGTVRTALSATDFRGLRTECVSCHADAHRGELGVSCESCHSARTFAVTTFRHARQRPFFEGQHQALQCVQCHPAAESPSPAAPVRTQPTAAARTALTRVGFARTLDACVSCHRDVHLGQMASRCESCHTVATARFAVSDFQHEKTRFPLTGKHAPLVCSACHKVETRQFPAAQGTATRFTGMGTDCASCHTDPHAGQFKESCQSCHTTGTFHVTSYTHQRAQALRSFFTGRHVTACAACHKPSPARPPAAAARTASVVAYRVPTTCTTCHTDKHRGALGPRCESCHRP